MVRICVVHTLAQTAYIGSDEKAITYSSLVLSRETVGMVFPDQGAA